MPRVIAGSAGGRPLKVPTGARPTADRVKEAIFSSLGPLHGAVVADLYGGSGGLAIEALSRGASAATCWETSPEAIRAIQANAGMAQVTADLTVIPKACTSAARKNPAGPFTHLFADPPYAMPISEVEAALDALSVAGAIAHGAILVLERDKRRGGEMPKGWRLLRERTYGEALIRYGERQSSQDHDQQEEDGA